MKENRGRRGSEGFTLVELMIVVVILGILAAIAIPAFIKYIRSSKTIEAKENLAYMFRESTTYYAAERVERGTSGHAIMARFPDSTGPTPATTPPGVKVVTTDWSTNATWIALKFSIADPHYYSYEYEWNNSTGKTAGFSAIAYGDLDGDGNDSTYERQGTTNDDMEVRGSGGLFEFDPTE